MSWGLLNIVPGIWLFTTWGKKRRAHKSDVHGPFCHVGCGWWLRDRCRESHTEALRIVLSQVESWRIGDGKGKGMLVVEHVVDIILLCMNVEHRIDKVGTQA